MNEKQWQQLLDVIHGRTTRPPVGFIIDSPWLPNWAGISILDYFSNETAWLEANLKAIRQFPQITFLPGFWSEYGMCTEPSAFGAKCMWQENEFPFAEKISQGGTVPALTKPDPRRDGMLPFVLKRLTFAQRAIEREGLAVRFAVARGPLNIASFLMGTTELMMAFYENPDAVHAMLGTITDFLVDWLQVQAAAIPTIRGVFLLDDIVGFLGDSDFQQFAAPYLKQSFAAIDSDVRFFHNDAAGLVCAPHLAEIGVNLFNFSHEHPLPQMKKLLGDRVAMLGGIPPRDVLARGTPADVTKHVREALESVPDKSRLILSCGGGMPPGVTTENIRAFLAAAGA